jgi:hypothetical protein
MGVKSDSPSAIHRLEAYDSVQREVLYIILIESGVAMKLVRLIKLCLLLKLSWTLPLLAYADDVNLLGDNIDTINKNTDTLIDASKEVGIEINVEKTKCMLLSEHQNAGQSHDIVIANRSFRNVSEFKYLGIRVTNQNLTEEEIRRRLNPGNDCYHSVQNLLCSHLLSKNAKIRLYKTVILPVVLYVWKS